MPLTRSRTEKGTLLYYCGFINTRGNPHLKGTGHQDPVFRTVFFFTPESNQFNLIAPERYDEYPSPFFMGVTPPSD